MTIDNLSFSMDDFRNGDKETFKEVYRLYHLAIYNFVNKLIDHQQEADDITAVTFAKLWNLHAQFDSPGNIKGFLYVTARNASMDYWRSMDKNKQLLNQLRFHSQTDHHIADEIIHPEVIAYLYDAIEDLLTQCRKVIRCIFVEGLTIHQTAEKLSITDGNVRFQKMRGLTLLRRLILGRLNGH